ncbi:MAG: Histidine triad (HIT) protein [uncultured bacterium (gcode 4)]|uniref:Histidine triad (HIT) protein n=1 Tax=uncultured bacterium (gcode 4) TaxID=1234023 RepID=K2GYC4_9BACT|nr:MAG: Histidine triad (HIT) protein [uncultured bacterium (gcode 4)]
MATIFDRIMKNEIPNWKIWEDENYLAFLTPFPNTPWVTIVIPKINIGDYIFWLDDKEYVWLMDASKKVAKILEKAFNTPRISLVFEWTWVAHVHSKLYPLHGNLASETDIWSDHIEFYKEYVWYITTVEWPKMSDSELIEIQKMIIDAQK